MTKLRSTRDQTVAKIRELRSTTDASRREAIETALLEENEPFIHFIARQYQKGVELDDLLAVARAAFLVAIRRFDPDRSEQFPMYASRCMRRDLLVEVRRFVGPVTKPKHVNEWPKHAESDEAVSGDDPEADLLRAADADRLRALVDGLEDREATVIRLRYGLAGCAPHQLAEIAAVLGVSKQRAAAIEKRALERLRERLVPTREAA